MGTMEMIILSICGFVLIFAICLSIRNQLVYNLRTRVLKKIVPTGENDFYEKMNKYREISYDDMLFSFKSIKLIEKEFTKYVLGKQ